MCLLVSEIIEWKYQKIFSDNISVLMVLVLDKMSIQLKFTVADPFSWSLCAEFMAIKLWWDTLFLKNVIVMSKVKVTIFFFPSLVSASGGKPTFC